jgi:hypothetical protein
MRPRQHPKGRGVRHGQHVPAAAHGLAAKAAVTGENVLENAIRRIHREQCGRKRHSVPDRLENRRASIGRVRTMPCVSTTATRTTSNFASSIFA